MVSYSAERLKFFEMSEELELELGDSVYTGRGLLTNSVTVSLIRTCFKLYMFKYSQEERFRVVYVELGCLLLSSTAKNLMSIPALISSPYWIM